MIKQSTKIKVKTIVGQFILGLVMCSMSQDAAAQTVEKINSIQNTANVKYVGISEGMYIFDVNYSNPNAEKFLLEITESSDNNIFREIARDKVFKKKFKIPADLGELKFTIRNLNDNSAQRFIINRSQRILDDVVVKKIN